MGFDLDTLGSAPGIVFQEVRLEGHMSLAIDPRGRSARSLANIKDWQSYLPAACVETMIRMGWDRTA